MFTPAIDSKLRGCEISVRSSASDQLLLLAQHSARRLPSDRRLLSVEENFAGFGDTRDGGIVQVEMGDPAQRAVAPADSDATLAQECGQGGRVEVLGRHG